MVVVTISGKAEAGKDTVANILKERVEDSGGRVLIIHYADYLKFICKQYFGWDGTKSTEGREILQEVGTDIVRKREPDFWVDTVIRFIKVFGGDYDLILIPDCRFPNEIEMMDIEFPNDFTCINVVRENHDNRLTEEQRKHPSETALDGWIFDYTITAESGIENLREKVMGFVEVLDFFYFLKGE